MYITASPSHLEVVAVMTEVMTVSAQMMRCIAILPSFLQRKGNCVISYPRTHNYIWPGEWGKEGEGGGGGVSLPVYLQSSTVSSVCVTMSVNVNLWSFIQWYIMIPIFFIFCLFHCLTSS